MRGYIVAGALLLLLPLAGCFGSDWTDVKDGGTLELEVGGTKIVALDTFGGAAYYWQHEGFDEQIVVVGDAVFHSESKKPAPGEPLKAVIGIRGLKAGETEITFVYTDFDDATEDKTRTLAVVVK